MTGYLAHFPFLLFSATANAAALIMLKHGMTQVGAISLERDRLLGLAVQVFLNPHVFFGLLAYVISMVSFLIVLSRLDVSVALPSLSISYVLVAIFAVIFLGEHVNFIHGAGILLICGGIVLIAVK